MIKNILVIYEPGPDEKEIYQEILDGSAQIDYLQHASGADRIHLLNQADVLIVLSFSKKELTPAEIPLLQRVSFVQLIYAGADNIPFALIPARITLASNAGAFARPIAEHVLALTLALAKRLLPKNDQLRNGRFDRSGLNQEIRGATCGIIGFGGNGQEIAKTMRAMGMQILGINRSGKTEFPIDFIGSVEDMRAVLETSHVVVVTTPLTRKTKHLIGSQELGWMKKDAILINVGRGEVLNQRALYEHLKANPLFHAGIDTWWSEPLSDEPFRQDFPFMELPNLIGSPHCADHVPGAMLNATRKAAENVKNFILGKELRGVLNRADYL